MSTHTNQIASQIDHMSLDQLSRVLMNRERVPVGLFVSQALMDTIEARWHHERPAWAAEPFPTAFHGIKIAVDPDMQATEFDVAFTQAAWRQRMRELATPQDMAKDAT